MVAKQKNVCYVTKCADGKATLKTEEKESNKERLKEIGAAASYAIGPTYSRILATFSV